MTIDTTRDSLRTSYDKLELYVYLEFYLVYHLLNHRRQVKQTKSKILLKKCIFNLKYLTKRNSPIPNISPASIVFAVSFGSLYMNKTTPKIFLELKALKSIIYSYIPRTINKT